MEIAVLVGTLSDVLSSLKLKNFCHPELVEGPGRNVARLVQIQRPSWMKDNRTQRQR